MLQLLRWVQVSLLPSHCPRTHARRSSDLAMRLQEQPFVAAFPLGWRYECVWETATRQDAELLLKVFRAVCCQCCAPGCELTQLPLPSILHAMDAIVDKAKYSHRHQRFPCRHAMRLTTLQGVQAHPPVSCAAPRQPHVSHRVAAQYTAASIFHQ